MMVTKEAIASENSKMLELMNTVIKDTTKKSSNKKFRNKRDKKASSKGCDDKIGGAD